MCLHRTGSPTMTGTMWLGLRGAECRSRRADVRRIAHAVLLRGRAPPSSTLRWRMLASAPAATCGRQGRGEDEAGRKAAHEVAERGRGRDIAADDAEGLRQRAFDHGQPVAEALALGDAAAARAIEADGMNLVEIGHGAVRVRDVAELGDRRDVAVHRVDGFERHELRRATDRCRASLRVEVRRVVMGEDARRSAAVADALDHRGVVRVRRRGRRSPACTTPACRARPSWRHSRR